MIVNTRESDFDLECIKESLAEDETIFINVKDKYGHTKESYIFEVTRTIKKITKKEATSPKYEVIYNGKNND